MNSKQKHQVSFPGLGITAEVMENSLLSAFMQSAPVQFSFPCNGQGICGKCRIKVIGTPALPVPAETIHLEPAELAAGIRLACQTKVVGDIIVEFPDDNRQPMLSSGFKVLSGKDPLFRRTIIPEPASLDWENIAAQLPSGFKPALDLLRQIPKIPKKSGQLWIDIFDNQVVGIYAVAPGPKYAVAVDLGTTTVAGYLIDYISGATVRMVSAYNPQRIYGADVLSRINFASQPGGLKQLHELIRNAVNNLIRQLLNEVGADNNDIWQVNVVGNSCMTHLFLGVDPQSLGIIPFSPVFKDLIELSPETLGIEINKAGRLYVLPGIGGFVGSDTVAGILACALAPERTELFIDIGTNGEIVLTGKGRMLACSAAAGPAFEGAGISCGMMAGPGAITDIKFISGREPVLLTINNSPPQGICGTGLIRIMVELIKSGIIDTSGCFYPELTDPYFDPAQKRYYLRKQPENPIYISARDIREFQLAKGAIRTGIELLMKQLGITAAELTSIYLAGAFGTYIKPEDAIFLGLLPSIPPARIKPAGNTAGMGAIFSVLSHTVLTGSNRIAGMVEHIELASIPDFTNVFANSMRLS